jgi:phage terminase small subunit
MPRLRGHQPPAHLKPRQEAIWIELVKKVPKSVLTEADGLVLEQAVFLVEKMRAGKISGAENNTLLSIYSELGCTPADRCKIYTPQQAQGHANDWGLSA